jgi:hypothetical protein
MFALLTVVVGTEAGLAVGSAGMLVIAFFDVRDCSG